MLVLNSVLLNAADQDADAAATGSGPKAIVALRCLPRKCVELWDSDPPSLVARSAAERSVRPVRNVGVLVADAAVMVNG